MDSKWTTYSDFSQVRSSRLQAAPLGSRCWNGCDSQKWEFRFHRLAILLTFRETVDTLCVCGETTTQTGDTKMMNYTNAAFNVKTGIIVKWNAERFVIIGDDRKVSDKALNSLIGGSLPKGWESAPV